MYQQSGTIDWETHPMILLMTSSWQGGQNFILLLHYIWAAAWEGEETICRNISESQKYRTKKWIKDRWNEKMILQLQPLNKCMQHGKTWRNNKLKVQFVRKVCDISEFQSISRNTTLRDDGRPVVRSQSVESQTQKSTFQLISAIRLKFAKFSWMSWSHLTQSDLKAADQSSLLTLELRTELRRHKEPGRKNNWWTSL